MRKQGLKLLLTAIIIAVPIIVLASKGIPPYDYKQVDQLSKEGKPKEAAGLVNDFLDQAVNKHNNVEVLRALIYLGCLEDAYMENAHIHHFTRVQELTQKAESPLKEILQGYLAELYEEYLQQNRYRIDQRIGISGSTDMNVATWSTDRFYKEISSLYQKVLQSKALDNELIADYKTVVYMDKEQPFIFQTTMFDFYAYKAIDFYAHTLYGDKNIVQDFYSFEDPQLLSVYKTFAKLPLPKDNDNKDLMALKIYQQLINKHMNDKDKSALVEADIRRLNYVANSFIGDLSTYQYSDIDDLIIGHYKLLLKEFKDDEIYSYIAYMLAGKYKSLDYYFGNKEDEKNKMALVKAVEIATKGAKAYPETKAAKACKQLVDLIRQQDLGLEMSEVVIPNQDFLGSVSFKNISKVYVRFYESDMKDVEKMLRQNSGKDLHRQIIRLKMVKEKSFDLPKTTDYRKHYIELPFDGLKPGAYFAEISSDPEFKDLEDVKYLNFNVSNIGYIEQKRKDGSLEFVLMDRTSGAPLSAVQTKIYSREYNYTTRNYTYELLDERTTDKEGMVSISSDLKGVKGYSLVLEFIKGDDHLRTDNSYNVSKPYVRQERDDLKMTMFTDRAIYRPGQTIYFKGILINHLKDGPALVSGKRTEVRLLDVNRKEVGTIYLVTDEFGGLNGSFTIPNGVLTGDFKVATPYGYVLVNVEEYKRPTFKINFADLDGNYRLGESVEIKGDVKAFAGYAINDAKLTYKIERTKWDFGPYYRSASYYTSFGTTELIGTGHVKSDEQGNFKIVFNTPKVMERGSSDYTAYHYTVNVEATNLSGETQSGSQTVNVGNRALQLSTDLSSTLDLQTQKEYTIQSRNLNGEYVPAQGKIKIYRLEHPRANLRDRLWHTPDLTYLSENKFKKQFPFDAYMNELDKNNWKKVLVQEIDFNTANDSIITMNTKAWKNGDYTWELEAKDAFGKEVKTIEDHFIFNSKVKKMDVPLDYWSRLPASVAKVGEDATLYLYSQQKTAYFLVQFYVGKQLKQQEWVKPNAKLLKLQYLVEDSYRGGISFRVFQVLHNRLNRSSFEVNVPFENKELDITLAVNRDKLNPGAKEEWTMNISKMKDAAMASILASMYDASLDQFAQKDWSLNLYAQEHISMFFKAYNFGSNRSRNVAYKDLYDRNYINFYSSALHFSNPCYGVYTNGRGMVFGAEGGQMMTKSRNRKSVSLDEVVIEQDGDTVPITEHKPPPPPSSPYEEANQEENKPQVRRNFNETAFFYPNLTTNKDGDVMLKFTLPESLTEWKFRALAYTKDLSVGTYEQTFKASKDLMVTANAPRFLRSGDQMKFPASVINLSDKDLTVKVKLIMMDAITEEPLGSVLPKSNIKTITVKAGQTVAVDWKLSVPENTSAMTYRLTATSGSFSDAEQMLLPVLTNRTMVTASEVFEVNGNDRKSFQFEELLHSGQSKTLSPYRLNLEFTNNPIWYAIQALPAMSERSYESVDNLLSQYYAAAMGGYIVNSSLKIKNVFDVWSKAQPEAFLSNLEKNQELKQLILDQTPWLLDANNESEQKRRIALYFDLNRLSNQKQLTFDKLRALQLPDGSFPWFKGMRGSQFNTQMVVKNIGKLENEGVIDLKQDAALNQMMKRAVSWLDREMREYYEDCISKDKKKVSYNPPTGASVEYLLVRAYLMKAFPLNSKDKTAYDFFVNKVQREWLKQPYETQAYIALLAKQIGNEKNAQNIIASLKDRALYKPNMGMYWKSSSSFFWYQTPIATQTAMMQAFDEVAHDMKSVNRMKQWLLKQKQTQKWSNTRATLDAVYALIFTGDNLVASDGSVKITVGRNLINSSKESKEAGTGYFSKVWMTDAIQPEMGEVNVKREGKGPAWGSLTFQYFEDLDKVKAGAKNTPLHIEKQIYVKQTTAKGIQLVAVDDAHPVKVGDEVVVQLKMTVDRDMDYVHLQDLRASGFEPKDVISSYNWQDGLGYYQSTKDASTDFFFDRVRKGIYVFNYSVNAAQAGDFSGGIAHLQSYYAPEFNAHSAGRRVMIEK